MIIISLIVSSCVEQIDIQIEDFENAIVVEALITNEFKHQQIKLSNAYSFKDEHPTAVTNAKVNIIDNQQNTYDFIEVSPGIYRSSIEFSAQPDIEYQLSFTTNNGNSYTSKKTQLPSVTHIDDLYAEKEIDAFGNVGVTILVDSYNPNGDSRYYRYEYEETYKIIAPKWSPKDLVVTPSGRVEFSYKTEQERICYKTDISNTIIQKETNNLSEDKVSRFSVRFLNINNPIISHRYSILVKQYVQSIDAYSYFKTLNKLSGSESLFSQTQPGFLSGNITSVEDNNEKVIGFFEVSSVSYKRLFFNYFDIFPEEFSPPYFIECIESAPSIKIFPGELSDLANLIKNGSHKYYIDNENYPDPLNLNAGPYIVVPVECGDCRAIGTNQIPDFWED